MKGNMVLFRLALLMLLTCATLRADLLQPVSAGDPSLGAPVGGNADSFAPMVNSNATHVLFASSADNLVTGTNSRSIQLSYPAKINVYLRNRTNGTTLLISQNLGGSGGGNGDSLPAELSSDGNLVLFESTAGDLVSNDTNLVGDIFLRNLTDQTTTRVSVSTTGGNANGASRNACMSADGRYVAFVSAASNLVAGDTNGIPDIFVRDLQANTTVLASADATAFGISSSSESPEISADGRYVAFYSTATNLIPNASISGHIYLRDLVTSTTILASTYASTALNAVLNTTSAISYNHALSADGKFVVYETSRAAGTRNPGIILRYHIEDGTTDIVHTNAFVSFNTAYDNIRTLDISPDGRFTTFLANTNGNTGTTRCVQLWDGATSTLTLASGDLSNSVPAGTTCEWPTLDASGRYVLFANSGSVLTATAGSIYVRDVQLGTTTAINVNDTNAITFNITSIIPRLSGNGQLAIAGCADQGAFGSTQNIFAFDLQTNGTEMISCHAPASFSETGNGASFLSAWGVSDTGRYVAFSSFAKNLVANDTNSNRDVLVRDLASGTNDLVSIGLNGVGANGMSTEAAISPDGRYVAFTSTATNLSSKDVNGRLDVFVADRQTRSVTLGSIATTGTASGTGQSYSPRIGGAGKYLLFNSTAANVAAGSFSGSVNLFLRNLLTSNTIALTTTGVLSSDMTPDGRYIVFIATGNVLYVWDTQIANRIYTNTTPSILTAAISPDGARIAFNTATQLYVSSRQTNSTWVVSTIGTSTSRPMMKFSADSRFLAYSTAASQSLPLTDSNGASDVFLYDFSSLTKTGISRAFNNAAMANAASDQPAISADGRFVVFRSSATNLVMGVTNGLSQFFLYDRVLATNTLLTANSVGTGGNSLSLLPVFSGDGRTIICSSWSSDIATQDFNQTGDLFAFNFLYTSVSFNTVGGPIISWPAVAGRDYQVQFKDNLEDPLWQPLNGSVVVSGNTATLQDVTAAGLHRFYRVISF
ncbi:MAG: hypothetical protein JWM68_115 [Verrucomicrobiales bacterium]|nr:hypothetical protein [Verrucomicrobiales bacterium]